MLACAQNANTAGATGATEAKGSPSSSSSSGTESPDVASAPAVAPAHRDVTPVAKGAKGDPAVALREGEGAPGAAPPAGGDAAKTRRPFANTPQEATSYIDEAVETRHAEVETCVAAARERRKTPHAEIRVELGIDQEGTLIGVKAPKGSPEDKVLLDCIRGALSGAAFPRSKAGVITLKKTFSDQVIRR
ncbi:hypothetical protein [Pendulispora albinea]|uniref:Uncharacterized protein n=1 Tax=Pendulispora albinea TaxID=2741071 RepID=A0ABZ2LTA1_9BACT